MSWHCGKANCPTHSSPEHHCRGWALAPIRDSVGAGGKNRATDVRIIQGGLNRVAESETPFPRFATTGKYSRILVDGIKRFQRVALGIGNPDGRVDPGYNTYKAPAEQLRYKRIEVDLSSQMIAAYQDGRRIYYFECMTGAEDHPTEPGVFKIFRKNREYRSRKYDTDMNYAMFFSRDGKAIHQYHGPFILVRTMKKVSDWFGSHGCVRLEEANARTLFQWASIGTKVHIIK